MVTATSQVLYQKLTQLAHNQQYRILPSLQHKEHYVMVNGKKLINIASNDYLGLASDIELQTEFLEYIHQLPTDIRPKMGSTSSRLLTGNDDYLQQLEQQLADWYQLGMPASATKLNDEILSPKQDKPKQKKSALVINSGYHANIGILPALTTLPLNTLILADKLVHASIIDGLKLSENKYCTFKRYKHNDYAHLQSIINKAKDSIERIIIVTESIFSMDGDRADLSQLVQIKASDPRIELYVDEAHAVGVLGTNGLGLSEETRTLADIDYLIGTFGKAFASMGAYIICDTNIKEWLINQMRSFIFSTALPPINHCWTGFILAKMPKLNHLRTHLTLLSTHLANEVSKKMNTDCANQSQSNETKNTATASLASNIANHGYQSAIIPYILGDNHRAMSKAQQLQDAGFYALPIRPPTVPAGTARIRLVMNAKLTLEDCNRLIQVL